MATTENTGFQTQAADAEPPTMIIRDPVDRPQGPGPDVMDAASLAGDDVVNAAGEGLGRIEAIMLDVSSGRIAYAVLSFGTFLGMGGKLFAIPWSALTLDAAEQRFILDVPRERLEAAPGFDKDHWPDASDLGYRNQIYTFYNVKPDWE